MPGVGDVIQVDPATLRVCPARWQGADPGKLQRQISRFGKLTDGMPPLWVAQASDGELVIIDGMTRATRIAKLSPGSLVPAVISEKRRDGGGHLPTVKERLP